MNKVIFWHRRDLRVHDNAGLYKALRAGNVIPVFVFDTTILNQIPKNDQRVLFIHKVISDLQQEYRTHRSDILILHGDPLSVIQKVAEEHGASAVYVNRDYEPAALTRDSQVFESLLNKGIELIGSKDQVIFEKNEVVKDDGKPYTVFTPYAKKWRSNLTPFFLSSYPVEKYLSNLHPFKADSIKPLSAYGFSDEQLVQFPEAKFPLEIIEHYDQTRDFPAKRGTSRLGLHLRFGTISIRELVKTALEKNATFLNELIWRDFYQTILYHFPHSANYSFKPKYDEIKWENDEDLFELWRRGQTGYPLVDAGMRELSATGFMHNRVRMVTASFLSKHLLIDWRWGEAWFAEKLLDYDAAANLGGWQWAAGCGCDAAPYFRVFNPEAQQKKFDPKFEYIRKWVPEFGTEAYPKPIVEHKMARERAIARYKEALKD